MKYFGCVYLPGNINPYVMSYYYQFDKSIDKTSTFYILPAEMILTATLFPVGSILAKKMNGRL